VLLLLFFALVALSVALRRAFVRVARLEDEVRKLRATRTLPDVLDVQDAPNRALHVPDAPSAPDAPFAAGAPHVPYARRAPGAPPALHALPKESLERQIGSQWLLYVGVAAIVIGVAYFEKLAFDNQWVGETARVAQGAVAGLVLIYAGIRFARAGYEVYGQMVAGCGAAILYVSTYAAFNFYHLIDRPVAFALMIAITAGTAVLADRQRSQGLAVLASGGGFATPFLLPGTSDAEVALFGYDAILIGGTMVLAHRRDWPVLNVISYVFTLLTVAAWTGEFYRSDKFLKTEIFLSGFCAMFLYILRECRRSSTTQSRVAAACLWTAPFAYYLASIAILGNHPTAMLVWLVALMLSGGIFTAHVGHLAGAAVWAAVTLPLLSWVQMHTGSRWLTPGLWTVAGVYAVALIAQLYSTRQRDTLDGVDIVWLHVNGLLMFAGAYVLIDSVHTSATGGVAAAFGAWQGVIGAAMLRRRRSQALHFVALGFTLLAIAVALQFDGPAVIVGWAAEGAVVFALGLHERREWLRGGGALLFAIASGRAIVTILGSPAHQQVLLNSRAGCAAFVIALCYALAWLQWRDADDGAREAGIAAAIVAAQLVSVALLTGEIHVYWAARADELERELMVSVTWAIYSTLLIVIGLRRDYAPIRYVAILLFAATTLKVFLLDMDRLERVYRIFSIIGLGVALLVASYLYQRSRRAASGPSSSSPSA
jgi:uncharacterized membrane protein